MKKNCPFRIPSYGVLPILLVILFNALAFNVTRLVSTDLLHHNMSLPIDARLPFVPCFILFYVLAFLQWILSYILIAREEEAFCCRVIAGELIAKLLCAAVFILLPTTMARPEVTGTDFFSWAVSLIYRLDSPDNLFPSIHVLESWLCFRAALQLKKPGRWYRWVSLALTLLVFASVLLIKQHVVVDIAGGILVMELGQLLSRITGAGRLLQSLSRRFLRKFSKAGDAA